MFVSDRMRNLVLEETRETSEAEPRRRRYRDDDSEEESSGLPYGDASDVRASSGTSGGSDHDDATACPHLHGRKPPGEKLPEVFRSVARAV